MDFLETLYNLMGLIFVLGTIISMGLSLTMAQITKPLRNVKFVIMALLINFIIVPLAALALIRLFTLSQPLAVGLLLVALGAGAPGLPKLAEFAGVEKAVATGLMVLLIVASIIVMPVVLPLLVSGIAVTFWDIASGLIFLILVPLALSLFVRARYQNVAASAEPLFAQASTFSLLALLVLMVVLNFSNVVNMFGSRGLLASLILVIISLAAGYLLGGRSRWVQALGAGQRNIAAAMVVATMNFGSEEIVMVVVFSLITLIVMTPLSLELGKRHPGITGIQTATGGT